MQRMKMLALVLILFIGLIGCRKEDAEKISLELTETQYEDEGEKESKDTAEDIEYIYVYVCGAVNQEGVYELPAGSRVYEAVEKAGGFREDADTRNVNQAKVLEDEERIYVPMIGEEVQPDSEENEKININKASKEELMTLPGVGESRAESIVKYREGQGAFQSIEDIMQVSGIKEGLFEKIKDLITI